MLLLFLLSDIWHLFIICRRRRHYCHVVAAFPQLLQFTL